MICSGLSTADCHLASWSGFMLIIQISCLAKANLTALSLVRILICWWNSFPGPSGLQPNVKLAPITVHDSDSEDEDENVATSRSYITNSITQNYSDGEERIKDSVEIPEPSGESLGVFSSTINKNNPF